VAGSRLGLSLLELLVAVAIVAVVVGLLIPAVTKMREAAVRTRCTNHMKLLGSAVLAYHDARGHFPPGGGISPDTTLTTPAARLEQWTWAYALLPHLGEDRLFCDPDPGVVRRTTLATYLCPARRSPSNPFEWAKIDYAANAGRDPAERTGLFGPTGLPPLRIADLRFGTSGVVAFAEKRLNKTALGRTPDDDGDYATAGWGSDFEVYRVSAEQPAADATDPADLAARPGFGSAHPRSFRVAFADGSVRPLKFGIDPEVWQRACHRDGAAPPPSDDN
jgi:type II secretory pathway pseudopilin PulG